MNWDLVQKFIKVCKYDLCINHSPWCLLQVQALLLAPICPHTCEHIWEHIGEVCVFIINL